MRARAEHIRKMRIWLPMVFVALLLLYSASSAAEVCQRKVAPLESDWLEHRAGEFIVQYTRSGEHALHTPANTTASDIPDVIADAATQLEAMRELLEYLQFQLPLESPRYQTQGATHVLVRFRDLQKVNGRAFDEVRRLPSGECVLIIEITARYRSGNLTPAHEYFHQVQNGYAPFKRPWFYEGTARWAETILGKKVVTAAPVPENEEDLQALWRKSYGAVSTWQGLVEQCDNSPAEETIPEHLSDLRYRDGRPVLGDSRINGYAFIRQALEELARLGDRLSLEDGVTPYRWPEKMQRDSRFDSDMWNAVMRACAYMPVSTTSHQP